MLVRNQAIVAGATSIQKTFSRGEVQYLMVTGYKSTGNPDLSSGTISIDVIDETGVNPVCSRLPVSFFNDVAKQKFGKVATNVIIVDVGSVVLSDSVQLKVTLEYAVAPDGNLYFGFAKGDAKAQFVKEYVKETSGSKDNVRASELYVDCEDDTELEFSVRGKVVSLYGVEILAMSELFRSVDSNEAIGYSCVYEGMPGLNEIGYVRVQGGDAEENAFVYVRCKFDSKTYMKPIIKEENEVVDEVVKLHEQEPGKSVVVRQIFKQANAPLFKKMSSVLKAKGLLK